MDYPDSTLAGNRNRQPRFTHRVHSRRNERNIETDIARQLGRYVNLAGMYLRKLRDDQHVVESQTHFGENLSHSLFFPFPNQYPAARSAGFHGSSLLDLLNLLRRLRFETLATSAAPERHHHVTAASFAHAFIGGHSGLGYFPSPDYRGMPLFRPSCPELNQSATANQ